MKEEKIQNKQELQPLNKAQTQPLELSLSQKPRLRAGVQQDENGNITEAKEINELLAYIYVLMSVGIEKQLNDYEKGAFIGLLLTQYHNYTADEVKHAHRLAVAGKLDLKKELYPKLDAVQFGAIMKAYAVHKRNVLRLNLNKAKEPQALTYDDVKHIKSQFVEKCVEPYINSIPKLSEPKISTEHAEIFKHLYSEGRIKLSPGEVKKYNDMTGEYWQREIKRRRAGGERILKDAPCPEHKKKQIAECLALFYKLKQEI
jgi:hypothetical protein